MKKTYLFMMMLFFTIICYSQKKGIDSLTINKGKWYFYCYASSLTAYDTKANIVDPLQCDINVYSVDKNKSDTTRIYCTLYVNDPKNICSFRPFELTGIQIIKGKLYLPIYHMIILEPKNDKEIVEDMNEQKKLFYKRVKSDKAKINKWLAKYFSCYK